MVSRECWAAKNLRGLFATLLILLSYLLLGFPPGPQLARSYEPSSEKDNVGGNRVNIALLEAHNRERKVGKLDPLVLDTKLGEAASIHARDMAKHADMSHTGSDGSAPAERVKRVGYHYIRTGENVAAGQHQIDEVMTSWMNSPGHKRNIFGEYTEMGAARAEDREGKQYWCVVFGTPYPRLESRKAAGEVVELLNRHLKGKGVVGLRLDSRLDKVALDIATEKARSGKLGAEGKPADQLQERLEVVGLRLRRVSQFVAVGQPYPQALIDSLLGGKDGKRDFGEGFSLIGVGYERDAEDVPYWCVLLGEP